MALSSRMLSRATVLAVLVGFVLVSPFPSGGFQDNSPTPDDLVRLTPDERYADVSKIKNVRVNLKYASTDNFMGENVYGEFHSCILQTIAAEKFRNAARILKEERPGWKFLVLDCLRPRSLQTKLFAVVKGTLKQPYVADPRTGSLHNYGFAVDLTLEDQ